MDRVQRRVDRGRSAPDSDSRALSCAPVDDLAVVWSEFCRDLEAAGQELFRPGAPKSASVLAEGHRYLTHVLRSALELIVEGGDAAHPALSVSLGGGPKLGWDNPDNLHHNAVLSGAYEYRLSGTRGDAHYFSLGV